VFAPSSIAEAVDLVAESFAVAERYRTPVMILADGVMGQVMEPVVPVYRTPPREAQGWELTGADGRPQRIVRSLHLQPEDLEAHNLALQQKYASISEREVRWAGEQLDDAEIVIVAYGTAARVARTAIERARSQGLRVGMFRPITLWPFPSAELSNLAPKVRAFVVVELSAGQMVEDVRLAVEGRTPVFFHGRTGGMVPTPGEVVDAVRSAWATSAPVGHVTPVTTDDADEPNPLSLIEAGAWASLGWPGPEPDFDTELDPLQLVYR
jgi:2-oxoglutarate ferredoxin oxidoreductase subunit alpha